jgi:ribosomal protein S27AE
MNNMAKPGKCSRCGSDKFLEIIYGEISMKDPIAQREDVELAGCEIPSNPPRWKCSKCKELFF